ncbi:MAG: TCR/Tet family MFS transporter, partial [Gemmatimonadales bacterium]
GQDDDMTPRRTGKRALVFIIITVLIDAIGFGIILPVMPELIMELTGADLSRAVVYGGWLAFAYAVMQFFCAPVLGNLSDRFGRRPVLLLCLAALGIDYVVMGVAGWIGWLFAGRLVAGIMGASFTPAYAYIADVSPPEKRAQNFGLIGAAFGIGFIAGPAIGGLLGALGSRTPFFAAAALALLNVTFGFFVLPETLAPQARRPFRWSRANPLGTLLQMRRYPAVLGLLAVTFLWQLGHQVFPSTWSFYTMLRYAWSEAEVGYSLAFVGVIMAIGQGVLTRVLIPRIGGERRTALLGLLSGAAGYVGYAFASAGWMMYGWMLTWFLGGLVYPSLNALMSRQVPASAQGELQGGVASLYSLSSIVGPPLMTQLLGYFSSPRAPVQLPGAAFLASAALTTACILLFVRTLRSRPAPAGRPAAATASTRGD